MTKHSLILSTCLVSVSACTNYEPARGNEAQEVAADAHAHARLCEVGDWRRDVVGAACKGGQKVVFLPQRWGNEQLPVMFAAVNCDLRFAVVQTNGGVTCVFAPLVLDDAQQRPQSAPKPGSGAESPASAASRHGQTGDAAYDANHETGMWAS